MKYIKKEAEREKLDWESYREWEREKKLDWESYRERETEGKRERERFESIFFFKKQICVKIN